MLRFPFVIPEPEAEESSRMIVKTILSLVQRLGSRGQGSYLQDGSSWRFPRCARNDSGGMIRFPFVIPEPKAEESSRMIMKTILFLVQRVGSRGR
jgi:hypothetical protein